MDEVTPVVRQGERVTPAEALDRSRGNIPRDTCPLLPWCFIVMPLGIFQGCPSCWALLYTFLSVNDSKEEFPRLLILLKLVL